MTCSLKLIRSLNGRRWLVTDFVHEQQRLIAHKMRSNTDYKETNIHSTVCIKIDVLLQCTDIDIMMYRNGTSHVPKSYYKNHPFVPKLSCTESDLTRYEDNTDGRPRTAVKPAADDDAILTLIRCSDIVGFHLLFVTSAL